MGFEDHPRLRGENFAGFRPLRPDAGSPPLARGKQFYDSPKVGDQRITPACAGKTFFTRSNSGGIWDHPRLRGENRMLKA